jgi:formamidopyrimidine-DNA glycosylase
MPELPEVEMVTRHLRALLTGRTFVKAQLLTPRLAPEHSPRQFAARLRGAQVESVARRGKHILTYCDNGRTLITHLRMTGRFLYVDQPAQLPPHTSAVFWLDNNKKLLFNDVRKFGTMQIVGASEVFAVAALARLAPEPLGDEFTPEYLLQTLRRSDQQIKLALLDQTKVLGLGNIYAAEALHRARINPHLPASQLSKARVAALHRAIVNVLNEAIANASTLNANPEEPSASYTGGVYEGMTRVYERAGLPCLTCATPIRRVVQGQRSTYYCPKCQRR